MHSVKVSTVLVFILSTHHVISRPRHHDRDDKTVDREVAFYCYKHKTCTPGDVKVCGYDPLVPWLAVFGDLCTLYKANCQKVGMFQLVAKIVCDTKIQYDKVHTNDTFEFIHVRTTTVEPTTTPYEYRVNRLVKRRKDNFPAFHCYKKKTCTPGGYSVCGIDPRTNFTAQFIDLCTFHGVNCFKQGRFYLLDTKRCPAKLIYGKAVTAAYGQTVEAYETHSPRTTMYPQLSTDAQSFTTEGVVNLDPKNIMSLVTGFFKYFSPVH